MTHEQFYQRWLPTHKSIFPGVVPWIENQSAAELMIEEWRRVLTQVDVEDAIAASRKLFEDRAGAKFYGEHPSRVKALAVDIAHERIKTEAQASQRRHEQERCEQLASERQIIEIFGADFDALPADVQAQYMPKSSVAPKALLRELGIIEFAKARTPNG